MKSYAQNSVRKRVLDVLLSVLGLTLFAPILLIVMFLIWLEDHSSPIYKAPRVGKNSRIFTMYKLRSMITGADKTGVDSTGATDSRITKTGKFVRKFKLDEVTQLWNVLRGEMSLVGPRPNVERETRIYTSVENQLLSVRPGITDIASIVFADEGEILKDSADPDLSYNQLIRPSKSRLGLLYVERASLRIDLVLISTTVLALFSRGMALQVICRILKNVRAEEGLIEIASRHKPLIPSPPPGSDRIVQSRNLS
jgi:lipopolysaccharide/colanic/teichoic acid biosynthesis glycosyltransferase